MSRLIRTYAVWHSVSQLYIHINFFPIDSLFDLCCLQKPIIIAYGSERVNPFTLEFLKWTLPSLSFDTSIWANRGFCPKSMTKRHTVHNENTPIQIYWKFYNHKRKNFQIKNVDIFHIPAQNIDCGYSLEPPRWGGSNEYPQSMFFNKIRRIMYSPVNPSFTI